MCPSTNDRWRLEYPAVGRPEDDDIMSVAHLVMWAWICDFWLRMIRADGN
jgi:hypothetical protein